MSFTKFFQTTLFDDYASSQSKLGLIEHRTQRTFKDSAVLYSTTASNTDRLQTTFIQVFWPGVLTVCTERVLFKVT
jgi:hypothetical protein